VGLPPLLDSLDDWHTQGRYGLLRIINSGGKPTFPTCYCAEVRQGPLALTLHTVSALVGLHPNGLCVVDSFRDLKSLSNLNRASLIDKVK